MATHPPACLIIDTDAGLDDFRAIAALVRHADIVVIVTTAGLSAADRGAAAVAHLVATAGVAVPVLVGATSPNPPAISWLAQTRDDAERLNGFLAAAVPLAAPDNALAEDVVRLTRSCATVDIVQIAPWSSFVLYAPRLGERLGRVMTQGDPPARRRPGKPGFNCAYDLAACDRALALLGPSGTLAWVSVPEGPNSSYVPNPETFDQLRPRGLPGTLQAAMRARPQALAGTFLWDDAVALYWLHPEDFAVADGHLAPTIGAGAFKRLWIDAVNAGQ